MNESAKQSPSRNGAPSPPAVDLAAVLSANPALAELLQAAADPRQKTTVAEVVNVYLTHEGPTLNKRTLEGKARILERFAAAFGPLPAAQLDMLTVRKWLCSHRRWRSENTREGVRATIQRALNFAVRVKLLRENPLDGLAYGSRRATGQEMRREWLQALLRGSDPYFRRFLIGLRLQGCRPGELCSVGGAQVTFPLPPCHQSFSDLSEYRHAGSRAAFESSDPPKAWTPSSPARGRLTVGVGWDLF